MDVALYGGFVVALVVAVWGALPRWQIVTVLALLAAVGLRDKTIFLAARSEVYAPFLVAFLLVGDDRLIAAKCVFLAIWWGAATSKLNRHFPFVVAAMESNSPVWRSVSGR